MAIVDISHHQNDAVGRIDWDAVRRNVDAAYVKVTEREDYTDPKWRVNHDQLAGRPRGGYHFCGNSIAKRYLDPVREADNFANQYLQAGWEMRPAYDIELAGASPDWLRRFRDRFRQRTGITRDRVYTSWSLIRTALRPELWLDGYDTDLWVARYNPTLGYDHPLLRLWQNSQSGIVAGFPGRVDTNIPQNGWAPAHDLVPRPTSAAPGSAGQLDQEGPVDLKPGKDVTANVPCSGKTRLFVNTSFTDKRVDIHQIVYFGVTPPGAGPQYLPSRYDLGPGDPLRVAISIEPGRPGPLDIPAGAVFAAVRYSTDIPNATAHAA